MSSRREASTFYLFQLPSLPWKSSASVLPYNAGNITGECASHYLWKNQFDLTVLQNPQNFDDFFLAELICGDPVVFLSVEYY